METRDRETEKETSRLRCNSTQCWKCWGDLCEESYEDLVLSAGP